MALVEVGTTALVAVPRRRDRATVRFQNVGNTDLYFTRQPTTVPNVPTPASYDFMISKTGGDPNESFVEVESIAQFNVVSSGAKGSLSIMETVYTS